MWCARLVCLTLGAEGALVLWDGRSVAVASAPVETVVDATAAGTRVAALKLSRAGPLTGDLDVEALVGSGPARS